MRIPIYAEVVPRELTWVVREEFDQETAWYVDTDGGLNVAALLAAFQTFFREHSEHWSKRFQYQEAWPQLLLQAFLQRVVNSGGRIEREYGLGRGRTDLLIVWPRGPRASDRGPHDGPSHAGGGKAVPVDKIVIECKLLYDSLERTIAEGLEQTAAYMDRCAAREGHLVIIDRAADGRSWDEKVFRQRKTLRRGVPIDCLGHVMRRRRSQRPDRVLSATRPVHESNATTTGRTTTSCPSTSRSSAPFLADGFHLFVNLCHSPGKALRNLQPVRRLKKLRRGSCPKSLPDHGLDGFRDEQPLASSTNSFRQLYGQRCHDWPPSIAIVAYADDPSTVRPYRVAPSQSS